MKYDTMNEYTLQSYFKSICNSFYIVYTQVERLEKQKEELEEGFSNEELEIVQKLIEVSKLSSSDEFIQKYVEQKCSPEELAKKKEELEEQKQAYNEEMTEIESQLEFWVGKMRNRVREATILLYTMKDKGFSIIITSEVEILMLMAVFRDESQAMKTFANIINTQKEYLRNFPTSELCRSFLRAYELKKEEDMEQVIKKYF